VTPVHIELFEHMKVKSYNSRLYIKLHMQVERSL